MRKLLVTFMAGLIACLLLMTLPLMISGEQSIEQAQNNIRNNASDYVVNPLTDGQSQTFSLSADDARYQITANTLSNDSSVLVGANRIKPLQDGESMVMQFTVVSADFGGDENGIIISDRSSVNPQSENVVAWIHGGGVGSTTGAQHSQAGQTDNGGIVNANASASTIFSAGNKIKATFTPARSQRELGVFELCYRTSDSDEWTVGVRASDIPESVNRNSQIWFLFGGNGQSTLVIENYEIYTTHGANLLSSEVGKASEQVFDGSGKIIGNICYGDVGAYIISNGATCSVSIVPLKTWTVTDESTSISYFGPSKSVALNKREALILEFDVVDANINCDFGFYLSFGTMNSPVTENNKYGLFIHSNANSKSQCIGGILSKTATFGCDGLGANSVVKAGNKVKIVYTPYQDADNLGSFVVYKKSASGANFTETTWVKNMGTEAVRSWNNDVSKGAYIRLMWSSGTPSFTLTNYREYTVSTETGAITGIDFDARYEIKSFTNSSGNYAITVTGGTLENKPVFTPEYAITFGGKYFSESGGYTAFVKQGESYTLPSTPLSIAGDGRLMYWKVDNEQARIGEIITPKKNTVIVPVGINISAGKASLKTIGNYGLMFETLVDKNEWESLLEETQSITTGTIIVPASYVEDGVITREALSGKTILDIVNNDNGFKNVHTAVDGENLTYYGAMVNIRSTNVAREFIAVGYIEVVTATETYTLYSDAHEAVSVYSLAKSLYQTTDDATVKSKLEELYLDKVVEIENGAIVTVAGYVSPYALYGGKITGNTDKIAIVIVDGVKAKAEDSNLIG